MEDETEMFPPFEWLCERKFTNEGLSLVEGVAYEEAGTMQANISLLGPLWNLFVEPSWSSILGLFGGRELERVAGSQVAVNVRSLFSVEASPEKRTGD